MSAPCVEGGCFQPWVLGKKWEARSAWRRKGFEVTFHCIPRGLHTYSRVETHQSTEVRWNIAMDLLFPLKNVAGPTRAMARVAIVMT